MKQLYTIALLLFCTNVMLAQRIDSIFFHLYTDSLKKGTYNYINVDGKMDSGAWMPLTDHQLNFYCSAGRFDGNSLVLAKDFVPDSVVVTAGLKTDSLIRKTVTIYVKKLEDTQKLKTKEEIFREMETPGRGRH